MLSLVIGIAGDPSQTVYMSASVFQDAFADFRKRQGLPAITLDLGKVVDIGIIAEKYVARRGVRGLWSRDLEEEEVMAMIKSAIGDHVGRPLPSLASETGRKQPIQSSRLHCSPTSAP